MNLIFNKIPVSQNFMKIDYEIINNLPVRYCLCLDNQIPNLE